MGRFDTLAKKTPVLRLLYGILRSRLARSRASDPNRIFTQIHSSNAWRGKDSRSGTGSDAGQTRILVKELPVLFRNFGISTMLDIPCGDFHWMKNVDLSGVEYTGADIVADLVRQNARRHAGRGVHFRKLDLMEDRLPKVDLVFCRDCLVHLSFYDILRALQNVCRSDSRFILTTTFTGRSENHDIATGQWRALNLALEPFALPAPRRILVEGCTEGDGAYADKSLGLWQIADIRRHLFQ